MSEVEETLKRISSHKGVHGILIVNADGNPIRSTLDPGLTNSYAALITDIAAKARSMVRDLDPTVRPASAFLCPTGTVRGGVDRRFYIQPHPLHGCVSRHLCKRQAWNP